ncbi:hypothetical protein [Stenotrophomonas maltophilia]|uniref:hypothetical protein n=1 Tax=Stenotrophomonas maltophilia TaxID=40324 RepID=UPI0021C62C22|nr:hypothetical protein [Stenotrophomonas maltophilia]MCU0996836.1 hypothetical protein [Stenotrophomonas maltophilia]
MEVVVSMLNVLNIMLGRAVSEDDLRLIKERPRLALAMAVVLMLMVFGGVYWLTQLEKRKALEAEAKRLESATYTHQLEKLKSAQETLTQLMEFVESQKTAIKVTQDALELKQAELTTTRVEQARLRHLAEADRALVDSILAAQQERAKKDVWIERLYGLIIGVIGTYLSSGLLELGRVLLGSRRARKA